VELANPLTPGEQPAHLRLYIARSTPNSVRAQQNLATVLEKFQGGQDIKVETVDVFAQPKRALVDGVVVTPTLIGTSGGKRVVLMGDLADGDHLHRALQSFLSLDEC
jgi:circadian clock protein KaiB